MMACRRHAGCTFFLGLVGFALGEERCHVTGGGSCVDPTSRAMPTDATGSMLQVKEHIPPKAEIVHFGELSTQDKNDELGDPDQTLKNLVGALTNHVDMRRSCGAVEGCYSCGGPAKTLHAAVLVRTAFDDGVDGDFVETGAWRGGISIAARMAQRLSDVAGESGRRTYVCDSFEGLPINSTSNDENNWAKIEWMKVGLNQVRDNFAKFHALDQQVYFVKGFFQSSLPLLRHQLHTQGRKIAVLRGDGDMFESYYDILYNLYEFVPVGGYFICDDCSHIGGAAKAVEMFRKDHGITEPYQFVDVCTENYAVYIGDLWWKKEKDVKVDYDAYLQWNATRHVEPEAVSLLQVKKNDCDHPLRGPLIKV